MDIAKQFREELIDNFNTNLNKIGFIFYNEYGKPELDPLRGEISKCLICDLCQASIALTNHLMEKFLKIIVIDADVKQRIKEKVDLNQDVDIFSIYKPSLDKYDGCDLYKTLNEAKERSLLTENQYGRLIDLKNEFRNPYSHAQISKISKDQTVDVAVVNVDSVNNASDIRRVSVVDIPIIQGIAQSIQSKVDAYKYFQILDSIIREVLKK